MAWTIGGYTVGGTSSTSSSNLTIWVQSNGTAAAPSIAVGSAANYGLYLNSGALLATTINGSLAFQVGASATAYANTIITAVVQGGGVTGSGGGNPLALSGGGTTQTVGITLQQNAANYTGTSGTQEHARVSATFAPTSGAAKFFGLRVAATINQVGSTGDYAALAVDVTETAATGTNKRLAEFGVGGTVHLSIGNGGRVKNHNASNNATSANTGASGAPPAQVAGYLIFEDHSGNTRKIPYYAN